MFALVNHRRKEKRRKGHVMQGVGARHLESEGLGWLPSAANFITIASFAMGMILSKSLEQAKTSLGTICSFHLSLPTFVRLSYLLHMLQLTTHSTLLSRICKIGSKK